MAKTQPKKPATWSDRLSVKQKKELGEVKKEFKAGKLSHLSVNQIWEVTCTELKIKVGKSQFRAWLQK